MHLIACSGGGISSSMLEFVHAFTDFLLELMGTFTDFLLQLVRAFTYFIRPFTDFLLCRIQRFTGFILDIAHRRRRVTRVSIAIRTVSRSAGYRRR